MTDAKRILIATDFSETSDLALDYAEAIARRLSDELHILHVYHLPTYALPQVMPLPTADMTKELVTAVRGALDEEVRKRATDGLVVYGHLAEGAAYEMILEKAIELGVELIILGTHGRSGLAHTLLGSTAERLVRVSPIPVTTVRKPR